MANSSFTHFEGMLCNFMLSFKSYYEITKYVFCLFIQSHKKICDTVVSVQSNWILKNSDQRYLELLYWKERTAFVASFLELVQQLFMF